MKNILITRMRLKAVIFSAFSFLLVTGCKTKKPLLESSNDVRNLEGVKRLPIEVSSIRDGKTAIISIHKSSDSRFSDLCFVWSSDIKVGGDIYTLENWREVNAKPLSINNAKMALNHVEKTLEEYYGDAEIKRIINNRMTINNLPDEEMGKYIIDPKLNDELDATYALNLIYEYREYLDIQEKSSPR